MSRSGIQARKKDEPRKKDERVRIMTALAINNTIDSAVLSQIYFLLLILESYLRYIYIRSSLSPVQFGRNIFVDCPSLSTALSILYY